VLHRINRIPAGEGHHDEQRYGKIVVMGNYSTLLRDHHGMGIFDRYRGDFLSALDHANRQSCPVVCEGGFLHPKRVNTDQGRSFCKNLQIIWLSPDDAKYRDIVHRGRDHGDESRLIHEHRAANTANEMVKYGAVTHEFSDREAALRYVLSQIDVTLDASLCPAPWQDYR